MELRTVFMQATFELISIFAWSNDVLIILSPYEIWETRAVLRLIFDIIRSR